MRAFSEPAGSTTGIAQTMPDVSKLFARPQRQIQAGCYCNRVTYRIGPVAKSVIGQMALVLQGAVLNSCIVSELR